MAVIDNRIVRMQFDNANFASKAKNTLSLLAMLKKNLNFGGAKNGIDQVQESASRFNMAGMGSAIDGINSKFLGLATVGVTALSNITNRAVDAGINIAKSLTVDPINDGLKEYELNMNSIQTILANTQSKGSTLEDVNNSLNELNTYADETIYNFAEMSRNIGTFTSAGVDLQTSTASIKGIANLAAISGSNSQQASGAMYQLSQAIAQNKVGLQDWNSVVNAGMGGEVFQSALFETAKAMGTLTDVPIGQSFEEWTDAGNSFRDSLQDGWITGEVLTNTLQGFTGDMTDEQLKAIGYTEEQIQKIQEMGQTGKAAATEVKTLTGLFDTLQEGVGSGWAQTWQTIIGDFEEAKTMFTGASNAIGEVLGRSADARNKMLAEWKDLGGRDDLIESFKNVWSALGSVLGPISQAFNDIFGGFSAFDLKGITQGIEDFTAKLTLSEGTMQNLRSTFAGIFAVISIVGQVIGGLIGALFGLAGGASAGAGGILEFTAKIGDWLVNVNKMLSEGDLLKNLFSGLGAVLKAPIALLGFLGNVLGDLGGSIGNAAISIGSFLSDMVSGIGPMISQIASQFKELGSKIVESMGDVDGSAIFGALNTGIFATIALLVKKFLDDGLKFDFSFGGGEGGIVDTIKDTFGALTDSLTAMQTNLQADTLLKLAGAIGILAASVAVLSTIDPASLAKALTAITVAFGQLLGAMAIIEKVAVSKGALALPGIAAGFVLLSTAVLILSAAVKNLADLSWEELAKGLTGVLVLLAGLSAVIKPLSAGGKGLITTGAGLILVAAAMRLMAEAVEDFGAMDVSTLAKGITALLASLAGIGLALKLMPSGKLVAMGVSLMLVATAMNILAKAVSAFGGMDNETLVRGVLGVGGALVVIAAALRLMPNSKLIATAVSLNLVAFALKGIGEAVGNMGGMSTEQIAKGLITLAGSLVIIAGGLRLMQGALGGAAALVVAAGALAILAPVLTTFANMSITQIATALGMLAGTFAVIGVAGLLIAPIVPGLLAFAGAVMLLGAGAALAGAGILAIATAFGILSTMTGAAMAAAATALGLIPVLMANVAQGIVTFFSTLANSASMLLSSLTTLGTTILDVFIQLIPKIAQAITELILVIPRIISDTIPAIGEALAMIVVTFIDVLTAAIPEIVELGVAVIRALLEGIQQIVPELGETALVIIETILGVITGGYERLVNSGMELVIAVITGIGSRVGELITAGTDLVINIIQGVTDAAPRLLDAAATAVIDMINEVANTVRSRSGELRAAGLNLATAIIDGMTGGILGGMSRVVSAIGSMASSAIAKAKSVFGIASPSKEFHQLGEWVSEGLTNGIVSKAGAAIGSMDNLAKGVISSAKKWLDPKELGPMISAIDKLVASATDLLDVADESRGALNNLFGLNLRGSKAELEEAKVALEEASEAAVKAAEDEAEAYEKLAEAKIKVADAEIKIAEAEKKVKEAKKAEDIESAKKSLDEAKESLQEAKDDQKAAERASERAISASDRADAELARRQKVVDTGMVLTDKELAAAAAAEKAALAQESAAEKRAIASEKAEKAARTGLDTDIKAAEAYGRAATEAERAAVISQRESDTMAHNLANSMTVAERFGQSLPQVAQDAINQVKAVLGIASPSKEFIKIGKFVNEGFANGLAQYASLTNTAAGNLGKSVMTNVQGNISQDPGSILGLGSGLTGVRNLATSIASSSRDLLGRANTIVSDRDRVADIKSRVEETKQIIFNQTNTSPVALNNGQIYRDTHSLISLAKEGLRL